MARANVLRRKIWDDVKGEYIKINIKGLKKVVSEDEAVKCLKDIKSNLQATKQEERIIVMELHRDLTEASADVKKPTSQIQNIMFSNDAYTFYLIDLTVYQAKM